MALVILDRVKETTSTNGTGTLSLSGALSGFQSFSNVGNGNTTYYTIESGVDWEVGIGTYTSTGSTLSRDTVLASSASGAKISVVSGAFVWGDYPADRLVSTDNTATLTNKTISGSNNTLSSIANSSLTNSSITINGSPVSLGGSLSVGTVTSVTATSPVASTGGTTPVISIPAATTSVSGYLTSTDWNTFNNKVSMTYPGSGIAVSTGSAWGTSLTAPSGTIVGTSDTQTLTNKRITTRVLADTSNSATPTLNTDNYDMMVITGQSNAITSFTTNLSGTPTNGQKLWIAITGTVAIAITWGSSFESSTATLPTTTVTTNRLDVGFVWNAATSKWRCVASA